jgi:ATP-dependent RNA helicase SUPV3L1/SUV3
MLTPRVEAIGGDFVEGDLREKIRQRLAAFVRTEIERRLAPLFAISGLPLGGVARGLAFQLADALGSLPVGEEARQVAALNRADRTALSRNGVRFGTETVYLEPLLRPEAVRFRALLWAVRFGRTPPALPGTRRLAKAIETDPSLPLSFYAALGFFVANGLALRADRVERLAATARQLSRLGPFAADDRLAAIAGVEVAALRRVLTALGYRAVISGGVETFVARPRRRRDNTVVRPPGEGHPFAKLQELKLA